MTAKNFLLYLYTIGVKTLSGHGLKKNPLIRKLNNFAMSSLKSDFTEVQGHKMYVGKRDNLHLSINGLYEPFETAFVKSNIKRGDIVVDIGANIGYYALIFAQLVGKEGKVFAFEPESYSFDLLKKNVEINGYQNIILEKKGVSNKTEKTKLYVGETGTGGHRLFDSEGRTPLDIETVRLDEYFEDFDGKINFIKMDIEGAEPWALEGMNNILQKYRKIVIMSEFSPLALQRFHVKSEDYLQSILNQNFKIYYVSNQEKKIKPASIDELLAIYPKKDSSTNIICVRDI